ncbi:hypothetical protein HIM_06058 [Hirsutella minnesotensis 3608]|uniref:Heme oxygenase-like protein n=1 Tax=Hirsutella minnesotensis 3608 TaxID=1043627 RepID=A0A0F7ZZM1_9HYPO|nr:hypothetical protein HIM_06058 [Hirsutella minnesotensis 3608]
MDSGSLDSLIQNHPLAEAIVIATRIRHAKLNKLIIARLPLALPPQALDSTSYLTGLLYIAPIYIAFEDLWHHLVEKQHVESQCSGQSFEDHGHAATATLDRMRSILASLRIPGLARSGRLRADVASLTGWTPEVVEEQLRAASRAGPLADFVSHIKRSVACKPHVLIAYTYIFFMALFAGGRYIRATLETAGTKFWHSRLSSHMNNVEDSYAHLDHRDHSDPQYEASREMPLRFFHFDTPMDGEDLKREYKRKLSDSEALLTLEEKQDIVQESFCIFDNVTLVVSQLDTLCPQSRPAAALQERCAWSLASLMKNANALGDRFRDSIIVTRQRWARSASKKAAAQGGGLHVAFAKSAAHPALGSGDAAMCPASAKSVKFDGELPHPVRGLRVAAGSDGLQHAYKWFLTITLGTLMLAAAFAWRRALERVLP